MTKLKTNQFGGRCVVIQDAGAGSSGKGSLSAWIADKYNFHLSTNNWMSNAGHFVERDDGVRILTQHIPSAFINPNTLLYINAGASITIEILLNEIKHLESLGYSIHNRLEIHPYANVITKEDIKLEKRKIKSGSTFKGCGASIAGKALRTGRKLAKDYEELSDFIADRTDLLHDMLESGASILVEGSQGVDLDLNHAEFPFVTSRQTVPTQLIADAGLSHNSVTNVILNLRTYPIRINNESAAKKGEICYTGNYWDGKEITWDEVATRAGWDPEKFKEKYLTSLKTSVTKKIRRVFEFPKRRFREVYQMCGGQLDDSVLISLNFVNFIDHATDGKVDIDAVLTPKVIKWLDDNILSTVPKTQLRWLRTGPKHSQIVDLSLSNQF